MRIREINFFRNLKIAFFFMVKILMTLISPGIASGIVFFFNAPLNPLFALIK